MGTLNKSFITNSILGFAIGTAAALPVQASLAGRESTLPTIDTVAQGQHVRELSKTHGRHLASVKTSSRNLTRALLALVEDSLPSDQKQNASIIARTIIEESHRHGLDPFFVMATIRTESGFDSRIVGSHGEIGLMQIRPQTAAWVLQKQKKHVRLHLVNPRQNIQIGTAYLAMLRKQFDKNSASYISAYNMGPRNLRKLLGKNASPTVYRTRIFNNYEQVYQQLSLKLKKASLS